MDADDRAYLQARTALANEGDKQRAVAVMVVQRMPRDQAARLVDQVYRDNMLTNRKTGFFKMVSGIAMFVICIGITIAIERISLYLVLGTFMGVGGFLWGLLQTLFASGFEIKADEGG